MPRTPIDVAILDDVSGSGVRGGLSPASGLQDSFPSPHRKQPALPWGAIWLSTALLIGLRDEVGGDWGNYFRYLSDVAGRDLDDVIQMGDPGYEVLNWISVQIDWGIYGVNLMCGVFFATGLVVFCRHQRLPWLALAVAVPYLLIVVAMGYSRQGVALGIAMLGLTALGRGSTLWFILWVALRPHSTSRLSSFFPSLRWRPDRTGYGPPSGSGSPSSRRIRSWSRRKRTRSTRTTWRATYQSDGTLIRLLMNAIPAVIYLRWQDRFEFPASARRSVDLVFDFVARLPRSLLLLVLLNCDRQDRAVFTAFADGRLFSAAARAMSASKRQYGGCNYPDRFFTK